MIDFEDRARASEVIEAAGGVKALVDALEHIGVDITRGALNQWRWHGDIIPSERCWQIEQALKNIGAAPITRFEMRPDIFGPDPLVEYFREQRIKREKEESAEGQ